MNSKYQEALNEIKEHLTTKTHWWSTQDERNHLATLKELVDKETPMKVKYLSDDFLSEPYNVKCPCCDYILGKDFIPTNQREKIYHQYCCRCGQKLGWSDTDE